MHIRAPAWARVVKPVHLYGYQRKPSKELLKIFTHFLWVIFTVYIVISWSFRGIKITPAQPDPNLNHVGATVHWSNPTPKIKKN